MISSEWLMFVRNHNLYSNELQIISTVSKHILTGGIKRLPFTVPALVFSSLKVCLSWFSSTLLLILFYFKITFESYNYEFIVVLACEISFCEY